MKKQLYAISYVFHYLVAARMAKYKPKTVVDVGGTGGLQQFTKAKVTDANILSGVDGCKLPYKDNQFDVCVSINTLEHVPYKDQDAFLYECRRVGKHAILVFPFGGNAAALEVIKAVAGHKHECNVPSLIPKTRVCETITTCREHMLSLALAPTQLSRDAYARMMVDNMSEFEMDAPYAVLVED